MTRFGFLAAGTRRHRGLFSRPPDPSALVQELRVLLVSDVHCSLTNVHRLAELLTSRSEYVDMIWLAGDVTRLSPEDYRVPAKFSASEGDMSAVLSALENIQCRVGKLE
jgi:Icc-related predicted phosphoesterase